jgi:ribosomal protein S18 acetylase RimI-like enzyme
VSNFNLRAATANDAEAIAVLVAEFQDYLRGLGDRTHYQFGAAEYLRDGFGADPAFDCVVAEVDATIAGYLLYHFGYDTDHGQRLLYIVDLYVREIARSQGIGGALMRHAAGIGAARGAGAMLWEVYKPNLLAIRFYEGLGASYLSDTHLMALEIPGTD